MVFIASSILPVACSDHAVSSPAGKDRERGGRGLLDLLPGEVVLAVLEGLRAPEKPRQRVEAVDGDQAVGKIPGLVDFAVGHAEDEHALEENRIVGVAAERRGEIGRGRLEVAGHVRASPGEVAAGEGGGIRGLEERETVRLGFGVSRRRKGDDTGGEEASEKAGSNHGDPIAIGEGTGLLARQDGGFAATPQATDHAAGQFLLLGPCGMHPRLLACSELEERCAVAAGLAWSWHVSERTGGYLGRGM